MIGQIVLLVIASLLASAVLFKHTRVLTWLAAAGVLFEAQWLALTLMNSTILRNMVLSRLLLIEGGLLLIGWSVVVWKRKPRILAGWKVRREVPILIVMLIVLAAAASVFAANSFSREEWRTHGFFNGDTVTLAALVERSLTTDGLVGENPFAGNGPLEYPTLVHAGIAKLVGPGWLAALPAMTYAQIVLMVPIFFLLWDAVFPRHGDLYLWPQAGVVLAVMGLSWDNYIYPQSHFFLTGMFLLLAALLAASWQGNWRANPLPPAAGAVVTIVLLFSNAIAGTAAVALKVIFDLLQGARPKISLIERAGWGVGVLFWITMFWLFTPGASSLGFIPGFSYTGALVMAQLAPILLLLGAGVYMYFERQTFLGAGVVVLALMGFATFVFSTRDIVVDNASRFFYHAILIGFPFILPPLIRLYYWFTREVVHSTRTLTQSAVAWGLLAVMAGLFFLPILSSVASAHDNLMFKDRQTISRETFAALDWIKQNTLADAVILANPNAPFVVPMFTGRAMLRSDYWLSPGDALQADVMAAFSGDKAAQARVIDAADYVMLTGEQIESWKLDLGNAVFVNDHVVTWPVHSE